MESFILYADGACRGNPGQASIGVYCLKDNKKFFELSECIGMATNNIAEYTALLRGCEKMKEIVKTPKNTIIDIFLDSKLVVEQMNGNYKIKNLKLKSIYKKIKKEIEGFNKVSFKHIYRDDNAIADALANRALDEF